MLKNGFTFCIIIHYLRPASVVIPLWLLFPLGEMPMYKGFQPFWIGDWLEKNGEGWERRVKDWLYPYPQCSCVCDKNRRGDCWMTAVSDLPGWRFWGCPNTALVLCSALWNVYSAMRNVYSPLRNVHSALRNINRMPVLAKLEQDEWILLNSYAACICIPVGVGRGPVVNSYITCICYFPFCSGKGSCGELNIAVGWYQTSATHAAEQQCQRTIVWAVPLHRYEISDRVNQRYQNSATGGTKSPILSLIVILLESIHILWYVRQVSIHNK